MHLSRTARERWGWWVACLIVVISLAPGRADARGGVGVQFLSGGLAGGGSGIALDGMQASYLGVGGVGVVKPLRLIRLGGELDAVFVNRVPGMQAGLFGDLVVFHPANLEFFLGAGGGVGAGGVLGGRDGSPVWYARPELGVQINLVRVALEGRLGATWTAPWMDGGAPLTFLGLEVGMLFGRFGL